MHVRIVLRESSCERGPESLCGIRTRTRASACILSLRWSPECGTAQRTARARAAPNPTYSGPL